MTVLTNKQTVFVRAIAEGLNQTQAAKRAGYSNAEVAGSQQIRNPKVIKALKELTKKTDRLEIATIEDRKIRLSEMISNPKTSNADKCKAIDLLNKMDALYIIKSEVTSQLRLTPEQAERRAVELYKSDKELWARIKEGVEGVQEADDKVKAPEPVEPD